MCDVTNPAVGAPTGPALVPVSKKLNVKTGNGRVMGVVREHYLRDDVPCQSSLCFEGCDSPGEGGGGLPADVTHYLLPLEDVVKDFFEVLEFEKLRGVIFLQSVVAPVQMASQRHYRKICAHVRDKARGSAFFANEFCRPAHVPRDRGRPVAEWKAEMAHAAANWYYEHLGGQKPIVIVTEDPQVVARYQAKRVEVFVVSLGEYLDKFWPGMENLRSIYDGIAESRNASATKVDNVDFAEYLRPEVLEAGIRRGRFIQGKLEVNKHHATKEAFVRRQGGGDKKVMGGQESGDVLVPGIVLRNRAVHGDVVVVELLSKSEWRSKLNALSERQRQADDEEEASEKEWERRADVCPTGKVVGVLQRNWREYIATIPKGEASEEVMQKRSGRRILTIPYDYRIPKVRILTSQAHKLAGQRIVVSIDSWPVNSQYPNGHFVRTLGKVGDLETEIDGILMENGISVTPFSQGILREMPSGDNWEPSPEEVERRKDLRQSHMVMSIDPAGCEDVDDTLSVRKLTNGNLELGVHIADVTHFVAPGSLTDLEARARATTVYLADRRYDMLPAVLSSNVCSLLGGVDRYAVSVLWELDPKSFKVVSVWYGRTVVRSAYKLFYEAAQDIIDGEKTAAEMKGDVPELEGFSGQGLEKKFKQLRETLRMLSRIALKIQEDREKEGALQLEGTEVRFEFEAATLSEIKPKQHLKIHETVAECMIFANHWVAKKIAKAFPHQALLRRHPPPKKENFEELKVCAASKGWHVDVWSNRVLAESLNRCVDPHDPNVNFLLRSMATYAMVQAIYFSTGSVKQEEWEHYGLALAQYTHFTSPIRRYADILVHRLLMAALDNQDWWSDKDPEASKSALLENHQLQELSGHINDRNRAAQVAQRTSQTLFQTLFFKGKEPDDPRCIVDAVIFAVRANGFLVYVPRYALKGPVYMQESGGAGGDQVLWYKKGFGPVWQPGAVKQDVNTVTVECGSKRQVYRLFDHVTVTIQLKGSDAHPHRLAFYFLSNRAHTGTTKGDPLQKGEVNFLKAIRNELEAANEVEEDMDSREESQESHSDSKDKSKMYKFFQSMRLMGIAQLK